MFNQSIPDIWDMFVYFFSSRFFVIVVWIISVLLLSRLAKLISYKVFHDNDTYHLFRKRINYITGTLIVMIIVYAVMESNINITTYIGLLSAGVAIALKELFMNISGWVFIQLRKPFEIGHRIQIDAQMGDVIDKRLFQFSVIEVSNLVDGGQSTGRIIDIPNSFIFTYPTINYTKGFEYIWNEMPIQVTFNSDWRLAKELLLELAIKDTEELTEDMTSQLKSASRNYQIQYSKLTPIVYTEVKEYGIQLTLRYLCTPKQRRSTLNRIWEDVLVMMEENPTIELAYPTRRVLN
ncbi:MAG: mechanosensitive ion channel family protein [Lachnospiraceae bacterium]